MRSDPLVQNLLILLAGAGVMSAVFAAALWRSTRDRLFRALFFAWTTSIASVLVQMFLGEGDLLITLGFSSAFLSNAAFAHLLAATTEVSVPWQLLLATFTSGIAASSVAFAAGAPFATVALPTAIAVATPIVSVSIKVFRHRWGALHAQGRALVIGCLMYSAHNLDFPFFRTRPSLVAIGFTIAAVVTFAISISAPAALLEIVTQRQARLAAQLEIARTLQARLIPPDARLEELDFAAYMRTAESVGGDYLHCFRMDDVDWFFVGDVTGHGFGANLFTLMAHSAFASIIEARPDISPRELNHIANRVLCANLARLKERRSMTIVSARRERRTGRLVVSGSHEDLLVYRAASELVESIPMSHFPLGLGFVPDLQYERIGDAAVELARGDLLFIGTDGVFEAARLGEPRSGLFGIEPVREALAESRGLPLSDVRKRLVEELDEFTGGRYDDDVAFLMLRARDEAEAS
jgi:serine phosphatase RsbU (regulator of sigma subunit)